MGIDAKDTEDLVLAHGFARAYREIDERAMRAVLAPAARVRVLMPRGYAEHEGPDGLLAGLRELATKWTTEGLDALQVELLAPNVLQTGRLASIRQRLRFRSAGDARTATMVVTHLVAIDEGRILLVDELCTGLMPQAS